MTDETVMEATALDALDVADVLFEDAADAPEAPAAEAEVSQDESAPDRPGSEDAEERAAADNTDPPEELKVVLSIRGGRAIIGMQRPSADPHIESFDGLDLSGLAEELPAVAERAKSRWEEEPRHPAHQRPAPPARRRNRREQTPEQDAAAEGEEEQQQPETLRLF